MTANKFKSTVLPHYAAMYRAVYAMIHCADDSADIVQDSMMKLWQIRNSLESVANLEAYCITAARRQCLSHLRARKAHDSIDDTASSLKPDDTIDVASDTERRDQIEHIERFLDTLPEQQRTVMRLSAFGGCSNDEIVQLTGISDSNVRTLLSRGRRKIRQLFSK